jgi:hypothetical protein
MPSARSMSGTPMPAPITTACLSSVFGHWIGEGVETAVFEDAVAVALAVVVVGTGVPPMIEFARKS